MTDDYVAAMEKTLAVLEKDLLGIRTGAAHIGLLEHVTIDMFGQKMRLIQLANVNVLDVSTLQVKPYDVSQCSAIYGSLQAANLGFGINMDANAIKIIVPRITEETRKIMVKNIKKLGEDTKISIRNIRRNAISSIKTTESEDMKKKYENDIQKHTNHHISLIDIMISKKEAEMMNMS